MENRMNEYMGADPMKGMNVQITKDEGKMELRGRRAGASIKGKDIRINLEAVYINPTRFGITQESLEAFMEERVEPLFKGFCASLAMLNLGISSKETIDNGIESEGGDA